MNRGLILLVACGASALAQTPAEQRGKKIIDQAIQALGGDNFLTMEDRIESGRAYSFYNDQISGLSIAKIYTRYITVAPEQNRRRPGPARAGSLRQGPGFGGAVHRTGRLGDQLARL